MPLRIRRHHYFLIGLIVLALGVQFRLVDSFVLNRETSEVIAKRMKKSAIQRPSTLLSFLPSATPLPEPRRTVKLPNPVGWVLISVGAVLVLHSLAMRKET